MPRRTPLLVISLALALAASGTAGALLTPLPGFRSPSGNIRCVLLPAPSGSLLCSIGRASYAKALQKRCLNPKGRTGAGVDWHGFLLDPRKKGQINCSGGILYNPAKERPSYDPLAYGKTWRHGGFTCTSRVPGVTCRNGHGHGIFVGRRSWRTW
jgi:hypothetical protein